MKLVIPKPFTIEAGDRAVLLLHGFTSNSADVRILARYLEKQGYTSHAPHYRGHGEQPENILKFGPNEWWEDVLAGYNHLKELGYDKIAVGGLSLGGVFSLKLGYTVPIQGIFPMSAPVKFRTMESMVTGLYQQAEKFKQFEGKDKQQIEQEMKEFKELPLTTISELQQLIVDVRNHIDHIYAPTFVIQGSLDQENYLESAKIIYDEIQSETKQIKWYEQSGHVITVGKEKEQLNEDIFNFLESLDWS